MLASSTCLPHSGPGSSSYRTAACHLVCECCSRVHNVACDTLSHPGPVDNSLPVPGSNHESNQAQTPVAGSSTAMLYSYNSNSLKARAQASAKGVAVRPADPAHHGDIRKQRLQNRGTQATHSTQHRYKQNMVEGYDQPQDGC